MNRSFYAGAATASLALFTVTSGTAMGAPATQPTEPSAVGDIWIGHQLWKGYDYTGGAYLEASLYRRETDGAMYYRFYVKDFAKDGKCAHGLGAWEHDNGRWYYDGGNIVCGQGQDDVFYTGARNWTRYQTTMPGVFVDGDEDFLRYLSPRCLFVAGGDCFWIA